MNTLTTKTIDIEINGFSIKGKTWGDTNGKPILAIHGWLDNANSFNKIAPLLNKGFFVVALDLAGHGLSHHRENNGNYYLWDYAMDILNCIDKLGWKKCSIIAHSLGTGVASIVAGTFPNRIEKLIFIDGLGAPFVVKEDEIVSNFKTAFQQLKMAKKTHLYGFSANDTALFKSKEEAIQNRIKNRISTISYDASSILIDRGLQPVSGGYRWTHDPKIVLPKCYRMTEQQAQQFIKNIGCETLIIIGKEGLFSNGLFNSRLTAFKKGEVHWITGGHHLHLEESHLEISALINQFL